MIVGLTQSTSAWLFFLLSKIVDNLIQWPDIIQCDTKQRLCNKLKDNNDFQFHADVKDVIKHSAQVWFEK